MPGSLIYMGEREPGEIRITVSVYGKNDYAEYNDVKVNELAAFRDKGNVVWINVDGIHKAEIVGAIGSQFGIHPLTQEDILNTAHRPKAEDNGNYLFIVIKLLSYNAKVKGIRTEQVSILIGGNFVISFQEDKIDDFEEIRDHLRKNKGRARELGPDYLAYRLIDTVIDNCFTILESFGDRIEDMEDELMDNPSRETQQKMYSLKSEMILIRRATWPMREVISILEKSDSTLLKPYITPYLRDLYDHTIQIIDTSENYREMISGMMDIYLSSISNRMNEVMKVLTIISTVFIPLNFIAGVYGMNFHTDASPLNMPELSWYFGYPAVLLVMLIVAIGLLSLFKKKRWF